jgi:hypothetical protein
MTSLSFFDRRRRVRRDEALHGRFAVATSEARVPSPSIRVATRVRARKRLLASRIVSLDIPLFHSAESSRSIVEGSASNLVDCIVFESEPVWGRLVGCSEEEGKRTIFFLQSRLWVEVNLTATEDTLLHSP